LAVALGLNPEGGSRNFNCTSRATHSSLGDHILLAKGVKRPRDAFFLRAEGFYNLANEIERLDEEPGELAKRPIKFEE
jgi:predicted ATPase